MDGAALLAGHTARSVVAWHHGQPVTAAHFLSGVSRLRAGWAGATTPVLNLCQDRLAFGLVLAAALCEGRPTLLPPDAHPLTLARLQAAHPNLVAVGDDPAFEPPPGLALQRLDRAELNLVSATAEWVLPAVPARPGAVTLLTSGSTGTPQPHAKAWPVLAASIRAGAQALAAHLGRSAVDGLRGLNIVATVPPQHSYGLESSVLLAWLCGAACHSGRPFFPADVAAALASLPAPRALVTTPFHLKTLLDAEVALPPVELILCATAPLSPQLAARAETALGGRLVEIYGCTEAGQLATRRTVSGPTWQTMGGLQITQEAGIDGERFSVASGHLPQPVPLADVLECDDATRFRLLGRATDLIHVAGRRTSLGHLNHQLNSIPGVLDGACWMPDEQADTVVRPVALVVAPGLSAADVVAGLRERLEPVFVPRRVVLLDALPRTATGKLSQQALRELAQAGAAPAEPPAESPADWPVPADHPAFAGHFPGAPVLPGVVLLEVAWQALRARPHLVPRLGAAPLLMEAKFLAPVGPGDRLRVVLDEQPRAVRFEIRRGEQPVASGRWACA